MTAIERTLIEIVGGLLLIWGTVLYLEHRGAAACKAADKTAVVAQEAHNEAKAVTDAQTINQEVLTHAQALSLPAIAVPALRCVRVDPATPTLPKTAAAEPRSDGASNVPAPTGPSAQSFDPGPVVGKIGQACDAQVVELQDWIRRVALAP